MTLAAGDLYGSGSMDLIGGFAEGSLVYLKNPTKYLSISPPSATLAAIQPAVFSSLNNVGVVSWSLVRNASGGSINATNGVYQSGPAGGGVDVIEAKDASGLRGRAYANVISASELASFGKAIIVGGGRDLNDPVWLASDYIANRAFNVLGYKGYARQNIQYLSFNPGRDIDGDGSINDIAGFSSFANVANTFTNWVGNANRLVVYLVDHGSATPDGAYFRLNTGENLTSTQLNAWLTAIQNQYGTEVVVVLDFCYAGRFVQDLAYAGSAKRVVIAATSPNELTYFLSNGLVSFSDLFLSGLLQGLDLRQAFLFAQQGMQGYQNPIMDDTKDGIYQTNVDGTIAAQIPIGATHLAGKDVPIIGTVVANQTLSAGTTATIWADGIQSYYPIQSVACTILPPSFTVNTNGGVPVTDVSEVALTPDGSGRYQASFSGFTEAGVYKIKYYAKDIWGSVSSPQQSLVIQSGFDERMIIVTGGSTNDLQWGIITNLSATIYQTALARRLGKASIRYLSAAASQDLDADGTNDVAALTSQSALGQAITNWAAGANKLTAYLLSSSTTNGLYRLNNSETLSATQLAGWLNSLQVSNCSVMAALDFDGSGSYIASLAAPAGRERIVIASAKAGTASVRAAGGLISFSQFFLNGIFNGQSLGAAFNSARDSIKYASARVKQTAQLDDNGDGVPDQKNVDGLVSAQRYLGAAFVTGEDSPFIGGLTPDTNVVVGTPVRLWAQNILSGAGLSNVWCVVTPPDYDGQGALPQTNLIWNAGTSRYEATYTNFTQPGTYACTFFARDNLGLLSSAQQSQVTATDAYEADDTASQATIFSVGDTEPHNFHAATDADWVKFYAPTGLVFNIIASQSGTNSDLRLETYFAQDDGSLPSVGSADTNGPGMGLTESLTLPAQSGRLPGTYYVRVNSSNTNLFGPGSEYSLQIYAPTGSSSGITLLPNPGNLPTGKFYVHLDPPQALAAAAAGWRVLELTNQTYYGNDAIYSLPLSNAPAQYTLTFRAIPGYLAPANRALPLIAGQITGVMAYYVYTNLMPRAVSATAGANGVFKITYLGSAGKLYAIQESTNLINWVTLTTNQIPDDGLLHFITTNAPAKILAFYRASLISGQLANAPITITNLSPLAVSASMGGNGVFNLTYQGYPGYRYALEESTNLLSWLPLLTNQIAPDGTLHFTTTNPPIKTKAFYRARLVE